MKTKAFVFNSTSYSRGTFQVPAIDVCPVNRGVDTACFYHLVIDGF